MNGFQSNMMFSRDTRMAQDGHIVLGCLTTNKKIRPFSFFFFFRNAESAPSKKKKKNADIYIFFVCWKLPPQCGHAGPSWAIPSLESSFSYEIHSFHLFLLLFQSFPMENKSNLTFLIVFQAFFVFSYEQHMLCTLSNEKQMETYTI